MRNLFAASIVGIILAIPLLYMIDYGFGRFEKNAEAIVAAREMMEEIGLADLSNVTKLAEGDDFDLPSQESISPDHPVPAFPINRAISNFQGKTIDVIITGRTRKELQFHSLRYNHDYSYSILKLSPKDQWFVRKLPVEEMAAEWAIGKISF